MFQRSSLIGDDFALVMIAHQWPDRVSDKGGFPFDTGFFWDSAYHANISRVVETWLCGLFKIIHLNVSS
jgi:hypothetical protein